MSLTQQRPVWWDSANTGITTADFDGTGEGKSHSKIGSAAAPA